MAPVRYMKNSEGTLIKGTKCKRMVRVIDSRLGFYILFFIRHAPNNKNNNTTNYAIGFNVHRFTDRSAHKKVDGFSFRFIIYFILEV